jgi:hypothetical protein
MKKEIKELQEQYKEGKIKKAQYYAKLAKLLEDETIDQDEYDEAEEFDPEADKPIYTQADVDGMIAKKATQQIRKILKDAGIEVDASNKDLPGKVVELVKIGVGKADAVKSDDPEAAKAAAQQAVRITSMTAEMKSLRMENATLKLINKYNPVSPSAVIALLKSDYATMIDYLDEETGEIDIKSVDKAFRKMQIDEPTLFKTDDADNNNQQSRQQQKPGSTFQGKGPGGNGGGASENKDHDAKLAAAKEMMGIKPATTK